MPRLPISVTLEADNLLWLKSRARTSRKRSVSDALDRLVTEARLGAAADPAAMRSVVGTVDLPADDPDLERADAHVRGLFAGALNHAGSRAAPSRPTRRRSRRRA